MKNLYICVYTSNKYIIKTYMSNIYKIYLKILIKFI